MKSLLASKLGRVTSIDVLILSKEGLGLSVETRTRESGREVGESIIDRGLACRSIDGRLKKSFGSLPSGVRLCVYAVFVVGATEGG